jgi:hypothetical protein
VENSIISDVVNMSQSREKFTNDSGSMLRTRTSNQRGKPNSLFFAILERLFRVDSTRFLAPARDAAQLVEKKQYFLLRQNVNSVNRRGFDPSAPARRGLAY